MNPSATTKVTHNFANNKHKKSGRQKNNCDPLNKNIIKPKQLQNPQKERPLNRIKSLSEINNHSHMTPEHPIIQHINTFRSCENTNK